MKTRLLLFLLAVSGAAHAQTAPEQQIPVQSAPEAAPFFRDVPRDHWAFAAVQKLAGAGIVQGFPKTNAPQNMATSVTPEPVVVARASLTKSAVQVQSAPNKGGAAIKLKQTQKQTLRAKLPVAR